MAEKVQNETKKNESRMRKWLKRLAFVFGLFLIFSLIGWRILIWHAEKTEPFTGELLPTCNGQITDAKYLNAADRAREQIQAMMAERQIPGLAVAVEIDGKIVWTEGFGFADKEKQINACPATQFRVASISKLFTAAAMARLYEQGRLDLDAPIQTYVPSFPDKGYTITIRQLASHRAGIRRYTDDNEAINTKNYKTVLESLEKFDKDPLMFEPDTNFTYSGYGFVLLSAAIESAAREDFLSAMRHQVFEPLGMTGTVENRADAQAPHQTVFYDNVTPYSLDGKMVVSPPNDFSSKWAAGGFLSTAEDLARFGSAHIAANGKNFLKPETLELLFTPRSPKTGGGLFGYGLGWMSARDLHLRRVHFNFGASSGGTAVLAIYPKYRLSVAVVANLGHAKYPFNRLTGIANPFLNAVD